MRALVTSSTFPIREGDGLPRFVFDLADSLASLCEVSALVPGTPKAPNKDRIGNVDVERFTYFLPQRLQRLAYGHGMADNLRKQPLLWLQAPTYLLALARATRSHVRTNGIDVVNSHWLVPQGLAVALARTKRPSFAHVLSVHAADVYLLTRTPLGRQVARYVIDRSDAVFADGSHVAQALDDLVGRPAHSLIQPMGANPLIFGEAAPLGDDRPFPGDYLLFFGRLSEKKGVTYLLQAMPKVLSQHPTLGLAIVGYGSLEQQLRDEVARLGIGDAVRFIGKQPHAKIAQYLRSSRVAIVPSIVDSNGDTEGMPTVVVEAMSAGVRVVASAVDGIPDVVTHERNGWLCQQKDPEDLAEKILDALADAPGSAIESATRATAERFAWPRIADKYFDVFSKVLAQ